MNISFFEKILGCFVGDKKRDLPNLYDLLFHSEDYRLNRVQQAVCRTLSFFHVSPAYGLAVVLMGLALAWCGVASLFLIIFDKGAGYGATVAGLGYALGVWGCLKAGLFRRGWFAPEHALKIHFYRSMGDFLVKNPKMATDFAPCVLLLERNQLSSLWVMRCCELMRRLQFYRQLDFNNQHDSASMVEIVREKAQEMQPSPPRPTEWKI